MVTAAAYDIAAGTPDPELPMLTVADLGILRAVKVTADGVGDGSSVTVVLDGRSSTLTLPPGPAQSSARRGRSPTADPPVSWPGPVAEARQPAGDLD
jgi:hypothetical protein